MSAHSPASRPRASRRLGAALVAALALLGPALAAPAAHAAAPAATPSIAVDPSNVTAGDPFVATVRGSGVSDLYSYDLQITFDPALIAPGADAPTGPAGGFTSHVTAPGSVTVSHTRLGTSPGLSGETEVVLASIPFRSLAAGSAVVQLSSVRLVSSTGEVVTAAAVSSASVDIAAAPVPEPQPSVASPSPSLSPAPSVSGTSSPTPVPAAKSPGDLAATGLDATPWWIAGALGVALIAGGALFMLRRRQAVQE